MRKINLGISTQNISQRPEPGISKVCLTCSWYYGFFLQCFSQNLGENLPFCPSVPASQPPWCFPAGSCSSAGQEQHRNLLSQFSLLGLHTAASCTSHSLPAPAASRWSSWCRKTWEHPVLHGIIREFLPGRNQQDKSINCCVRGRRTAALYLCDLVLSKENPNPGSGPACSNSRAEFKYKCGWEL